MNTFEEKLRKLEQLTQDIKRSDISTISVKHHWSYDELYIKTRQGITYNTKCENKHIKVIENGYARQYALCKLDYIELGNR
jgi:hypothetical protein